MSLSYFDLFRSPFSLFINKKKRISTQIGVFFSFSLYAFLLYNFTQSDLFLKLSPYVVSQTVANVHANRITFDENTLVSFAVSDQNNQNYIEPEIFTVTFKFEHLVSDDSGVMVLIDVVYGDLRACTLDDVQFDPDLFVQLGLQNSFCLQNKSFFLEGYWDEQEIYYAYVKVNQCLNDTSNVTCRSQEEINDFFSTSKYFGANFQSVALTINDYEQPIKRKYQNIYQWIDVQILKRFNVFFNIIDVTTDDGWFHSQKSTISDFLMETLNNDFVTRSLLNSSLSEILFFASHDSQENMRRYETLSEALASISGVANFCLLALLVITNLQNHLDTMKIIMNSLYKFPKKKNNKKKKWSAKYRKSESDKKILSENQLQSSNQKFGETNASSKIEGFLNKNLEGKMKCMPLPNKIQKEDSFVLEHYSQNDNNENTDGPNLPKTESVICQPSKLKKPLKLKLQEKIDSAVEKVSRKKKKSKGFSVNMFDFVVVSMKSLCKCCKKTKNQKIIEKTNDVFLQEMDIVTILSKIHEIERLKLVLLNKEQLVLFDNISKPMIWVEDDDDEEDSDVFGVKKPSKKMSTMIKSYKSASSNKARFSLSLRKIQRQKEKNLINKKLLELIDHKK